MTRRETAARRQRADVHNSPLIRITDPSTLTAGDSVFVVRFGHESVGEVNTWMTVKVPNEQFRLRVRAAKDADLVIGLRPIGDPDGGEAYLATDTDLITPALDLVAKQGGGVSTWLAGQLASDAHTALPQGTCATCVTAFPCDPRRDQLELAALLLIDAGSVKHRQSKEIP